MVTARSTPNIALIKYWGNRQNDLRLPAADSLSMTLDQPTVDITVAPSESMAIRSFHGDDTERQLQEKDTGRFAAHRELTNAYLRHLGYEHELPPMTVTIRSHIPPSIGLASSAAVFSALARAYAGLLKLLHDIDLTDTEISVIARLGSGSACRGVYGGYSAIRVMGDGIGDAYAEQVADEDHWTLHNIIIAPSTEEKRHGSTEGHAIADTSPYYRDRLAEIPRRQREGIDAIRRRDFEKLQHVAEEDCMNMHHVMRTSQPPLFYLHERTYEIVDDILSLRHSRHLPVLFTMDAGPTVHLFCTEEALADIRAYAKEQQALGCIVFESRVGRGAHLV